ncbi:MAG TPA: hypothetical protein VGK67_01870 [Myxococcales bacterium]
MRDFLLASATLALVTACQAPEGTITASGGEVRGPGQSAVSVPAGAVSQPLSIRMKAASPSPLLPAELLPAGRAVLVEPEGATFAKPVTVTLDVSGVPEGAHVQIATAPAGSTQFTLLPAARSGQTVTAQTSHFSVFVPVVALDLSVFDDFCRAYNQAQAERGAACAGGTAEMWKTFLASRSELFCQGVSDSLAHGRATFDGSRAADCVAALRAASCEEALYPNPSMFCPDLFVGTTLPGQPCYQLIDCFPWGHCDTGETLQQCPGVCREPAFGNPCNWYDECVAPNVCYDGTCRPPSREGEPCASWCERGLFCEEGKCARRRNYGPCPTGYDECSVDSVCIGLGTVRKPTDLTCVPVLPIGAKCAGEWERECGLGVCIGGVCTEWSRVGEPCSYSGNRLCIDGYCHQVVEGELGTCRSFAKEGEPCRPVDVAPICATGLTCDSGTGLCVSALCRPKP